MALLQTSGLVVTTDGPSCVFDEGTVQVAGIREESGYAVGDVEGAIALAAHGFRVLSRPEAAGGRDLVGPLTTQVTSFPVNYYQRYRLAPGSLGPCSSGSSVSFRLEFDHAECTVTVRVLLQHVGDGDRDDRAGWRRAIEDAWSNHYDLVATDGSPPCARYRIKVDVDWVPRDAADFDYTVRGHDECGRADMFNWYTSDPYQVAAHEFGHMLGNIDEYVPDRRVQGQHGTDRGRLWRNRGVRTFCQENQTRRGATRLTAAPDPPAGTREGRRLRSRTRGARGCPGPRRSRRSARARRRR